MRCRTENRIDGKTDVWGSLLCLYFPVRYWKDNWEIWVCYQDLSFCLLCAGWARRRMIIIPSVSTTSQSLWEYLQQDSYHVAEKLEVSPWRNWTVLEKRSPHFGLCGFPDVILLFPLYSQVDKLVHKWSLSVSHSKIYNFWGDTIQFKKTRFTSLSFNYLLYKLPPNLLS